MLAAAATSKCFSAIQGIERNASVTGNAETGQQRLCRRDLVGRLGYVDVGEHQSGVGGKGAEHPCCGTVTKLVEAAAQGPAIERDAALSGCASHGLQHGGMTPACCFRPGRIEPLEDIAHGGMRRCSAPVQTEHRVQPAACSACGVLSLRRWTSDEGDDAAMRVAAAHDGRYGEQQHMAQRVKPGADQEPPPTRPATAKTQPRQPPARLPSQEASDMRRLGNLLHSKPPRFGPHPRPNMGEPLGWST